MKQILFFLLAITSLFSEDYLVLLRHGRSESNEARFFNSDPSHPNYKESNLVSLGKKQALHAANLLKKKKIDPSTIAHAFISPLPRTRQTAQVLIEEGIIGLDQYTVSQEIIEIRMGDLESRPYSSGTTYYHLLPEDFGGETYQQVRKRMVTFLHKQLQTHNEGHILFVSHKTPLEELYRELTGEEKIYIPYATPYYLPLSQVKQHLNQNKFLHALSD